MYVLHRLLGPINTELGPTVVHITLTLVKMICSNSNIGILMALLMGSIAVFLQPNLVSTSRWLLHLCLNLLFRGAGGLGSDQVPSQSKFKAVRWCYYVGTLQTGAETDALIHFKM